MNKLLMAAIAHYHAQKTEALAHLDLLFNDAVQIGEHTDLLTEVKKWTDSLAQAIENLQVLQDNFDVTKTK